MLLEAVNIECLRGDRHLFSEMSFLLKPGECLLIQGANGCGKSSLLRILAGLVAPSSGTMIWNRRPIKPLDDEYRRQVSYLGHSLGLKEDLSALENLDFASAMANEPVKASALHEALYRVGLSGKEDLRVGALSQGQKRRVNLARLLLNRRAVWVLDEPLTALDAQATQWIVETVERHLEGGGLAVITTHQDIPLAHATQRMRIAT